MPGNRHAKTTENKDKQKFANRMDVNGSKMPDGSRKHWIQDKYKCSVHIQNVLISLKYYLNNLC